MKHLFIINPAAGSRDRTKEYKEQICKLCNKRGLDFKVEVSKAPGNCRELARQAAQSGEEYRIYACGGDGTVNEVLNGLVGAKNAELAILAIGTGNDFVKVYGGETKFQSFETLIKGETKEADLSKITAETLDEPMYSINVVNFGFDAIVGAKGNYYKEHGYPEKAKKKGMNPYDYALKIISNLLSKQ